MSEDAKWLAAFVFPIIFGLIGVLYAAGQRRDDKQDIRATEKENTIDEHSQEIAKLMTDVANLKEEVRGVRKRYHDYRDEVTHTLAGWYTDVTKTVNERFSQRDRNNERKQERD